MIFKILTTLFYIMIQHFKSHSLKKLNTFGMDVYADEFYEYSTVDELEMLLNKKSLTNKRLLNLGSGSNFLFTSDFKGVILHSRIEGIEIAEESNDEVIIAAGAGVIWDELVKWCVDKGFGGIENLSLIPGTVGASVVQNIGAYGVELKDVFCKVEGIYIETGEKFIFYLDECDFDYRFSIFKGTLKNKIVITRLFLKLSKIPVFNIEYGILKSELDKQNESISLQNIRNAIIEIRNSKLPDPAVTGNAGSFFKNPIIDENSFFELKKNYPNVPFYEVSSGKLYKIPAGWLIEQSGWKGKNMGHAAIHPKQALVIINLGNATGNEIIELATAIEKDIYDKFGIILEKEVEVIK